MQFLLRTNRQQLNSPLFLLGESSGNNSKDEVETTGTFISGELQKGTVKVNVRLGGNSVFSLRSSSQLSIFIICKFGRFIQYSIIF
jgi:hypothetical protein